MSISDALAQLNVGRYHDWQAPFSPANAKQAVLAFKGDVYEGLNAASLEPGQLSYLQPFAHLVRPLRHAAAAGPDAALPLGNGHPAEHFPRQNLYEFWGDTVTHALNAVLEQRKDPVLVNLASEEYFKAVKPAKLNASLITPVFQDRKNGQYKIISLRQARARHDGALAALHQVSQPEQLKHFNSAGYAFDAAASSELSCVPPRSALNLN